MDISRPSQGSNGIYIPLQEQSFSNPNVQNQFIPQGGCQVPQPHQQIIVNQPIQPQVIYIDTANMKTSPCNMTCPFCKNQITTQVKKTFNWYNCIFCLWAGICCWAGIQFCKSKDLNCNDSEHFCPYCRNKIADYSSC